MCVCVYMYIKMISEMYALYFYFIFRLVGCEPLVRHTF